MSFNMVANRVDKGLNIAYLEKLMSKLKMSKDKTYAENIPEWEEATKNTFATAGIGHLLSKFSSRMTPPDQVAALQVERELGVVLSGIKWGSGSLFPSPSVKIQPMEPPSTMSAESSKSPRKPEKKVEQSNISEAERLVELEALIRETAREMTEELQMEHAQSESRGVRKEVIFLEHLTSVPERKAYLNPKATVLTTIDGVTRLYEPESDLKRLQRQAGWQLITQSVSDMPPANWKGIALGNVHGLYTLITSHYRENDRKSVVKELNARLTSLGKSQTELFVTFHARYEQLILEMDKVGMNVDDDVLYTHVERALTTSDDEEIKKIYEHVLLLSGKPETTQALFAILLPAMKRLENDARTKHDLNGDDTENERKKKKKEKAEAARTLRTQTHSSAASKSSDIMGTCLDFSTTGNCSRTNCAFKHERLSKENNEKLKEAMKASRERMVMRGDWSPPTCYACGEKGHISTHCQKKENKTVVDTKTAMQSDSGDSMRAMHEHTKHMTNEQVQLFAHTLMSQREAESAGKGEA
jgi:hypothetical protein